LNNLRRTNNNNFIDLFDIFVKKIVYLNNTKKREISNSIIVKIENFNNIVKKIIRDKKLDIRFKIIQKS